MAICLQDFLKCNKSRFEQLTCQCYDPIPLGEGAGVGWMKGADSMAMPEGSSLFDLIQTGLTYTHAAVGVVVRLRKELSMVKDIPVLIAIDQVRKKPQPRNSLLFIDFEVCDLYAQCHFLGIEITKLLTRRALFG